MHLNVMKHALWFFFLTDKFNLREAIKFKNWNFSEGGGGGGKRQNQKLTN